MIAVTGGAGQVATALGRADPARVRVFGRPTVDFDRPETLAALFAEGAPDVLVNAAAWTAVDAAESDESAARRVNAEAPGALAALCAQHGTRLLHLSTDYVFDGLKGAPYCEEDETNPMCAYGRTKREGEERVLAADGRAIVLRTSWVYAENGRNFARTMLRAAQTAPVLRVVDDQRGCPTNADDLAAAILAVADRVVASPDVPGGVFHAAGAGEATWFGFARAIFNAAGRHGGRVPELAPIRTEEWPTPARRPPDSRLDCGRLASVFGVALPPWEPSLARAVGAMLAEAGV